MIHANRTCIYALALHRRRIRKPSCRRSLISFHLGRLPSDPHGLVRNAYHTDSSLWLHIPYSNHGPCTPPTAALSGTGWLAGAADTPDLWPPTCKHAAVIHFPVAQSSPTRPFLCSHPQPCAPTSTIRAARVGGSGCVSKGRDIFVSCALKVIYCRTLNHLPYPHKR